MANMQERLEASVAQAELDVAKLHNIINGNDTTAIETENGLVSSIAKHLKDIKTEIMNGVNATIDKADSDIAKIHELVNGDDTTIVETENGELPSLAKTLKEIRQELTDGVDEIVGTALSAKEIILEAQADVTGKHGQIVEIKSDIDATKANIETINQTFENTIGSFETAVSQAILDIDSTKDGSIVKIEEKKAELSEILSAEKDTLIGNLQSETLTQIQNLEENGTIQEKKAKDEADRAQFEANRVSQPLISRDETDGDIVIDWNLNQDYSFSLNGGCSLSFINLPDSDNQSNFRQIIVKSTVAITPTFAQNISFAEASPPKFSANRAYQLIFQYIAADDKILAGFVEY